MRGRRFRLYVMYLAVVFAGAGCFRDDFFRQSFTGYVTLDGRPIKHGVIAFYPDGVENPDDVTHAGAMIHDGRFSVPGTEGLLPGKYRIAINAGEIYDFRRRSKAERTAAVAANKELVPAKYNARTVLAIAVRHTAIKEMTIRLLSHEKNAP